MEKVNQVTAIVQNLKEPSERLVMIDDLRRLGIEYHFQEEIESLLCGLCENYGALSSLYDIALSFRLLREHGHNVSQGGS